MKHRLYDASMLIGALRRAGKHSYRNVLDEYLREGAHPFFLLQAVQVVSRFLGDESLGKHLTAVADQRVANRHEELLSKVPAPTEAGLMGPVSRLYLANGNSRMDLPEGLMSGVFMETLCLVLDSTRNALNLKKWRICWEQVLSRLLSHPEANAGLADDAFSLIISCEQAGIGGAEFEMGSFPFQHIRQFLEDKLQKAGIESLAREIFGTWCETRAHFFWALWLQFFLLDLDDVCPKVRRPYTQLLANVLDLASTTGLVGQGASEFLQLYPKSKAKEVLLAISFFLERLKDELPNEESFHLLVRWLQFAYKNEARETLLMNLITRKSETGAPEVDTRTEHLVEEFVGEEATKAMWQLISDDQAWKEITSPEQFDMRTGVKRGHPASRIFLQKLKEVRPERHDYTLALAIDSHIAKARVTEEEAKKVWEEAVDLLASDVVITVTHLTDQWMPLPRREDEFLGQALSLVNIATHPTLGQNGAACRFSIDLAELPDKPITGMLDAEGNMSLDHIAALTPIGRTALQAVVASSVAALLIPRYLDMVPPRGEKGGGFMFADEIFARRPIVHALGDLSEPPEEEIGIVCGGNRINPRRAMQLFLWLLDEDLACPFRLHRKTAEMVGSRDEVCYPTWREAKDRLRRKRTKLSEVYFRTIRAHTRPVAGKIDGRTVVFQQMSDAAWRKYERFLSDIGRKLDFSSVRKTYLLPGDIRVVLDVPRTFNQGTFNTLDEVWLVIPDRKLKARAREAFTF